MKEKEYNAIVIITKTPLRKSIKIGLHDNIPNIHVDEAATGKEAVEKLEQTKYDIILCDWELSDINGYEILQWVRAHSLINATPFIIISSINDKETILKAIKGGANAYVVKPFSIGSLVQKIHAVFDALEKTRLQRVNVSGAISLNYDTSSLKGDIIDLCIEDVFATFKRNDPLPTLYDKVLVDLKLGSTEITGIEGFIIKMETIDPHINAESLKTAVKFTELGNQNKKQLQKLIYSS